MKLLQMEKNQQNNFRYMIEPNEFSLYHVRVLKYESI